MNQPTTVREALIAEALGDIAHLLDRVESLTSATDSRRLALEQASAQLDARLGAFGAGMSSLTHQAKTKAVEHILQRTGEAARQTVEAQTRAMEEAARLAFEAQVEPMLARINASFRQIAHRVDRPWDLWLTHAATAAVSAVFTWLLTLTIPVG